METNKAIPSNYGSDILSPIKKATSKSEKTEPTDSEFINNFLTVLITNLNPNDLSLDKDTSDKLSKLISNEAQSNKDLSGLDLKQFIANLKNELSNGKPHKLSLDGLESIVEKLLNNNNLKMLSKETNQDKLIDTSSESINENIFNKLGDLTGKFTKSKETLVNNLLDNNELKDENLIKTIDTVAVKSNKDEKGIEKLLFNLRKFLTKDEFNLIKKNLQSGNSKETNFIAPKLTAISKYLSIITGKENEAKNKIELKSNDISLDVSTKKSDNLPSTNLIQNAQIQASDDLTTVLEKESKFITNTSENNLTTEKKAENQAPIIKGDDNQISKSKIIADKNTLEFEINNKNGQIKLEFDNKGEGPLSKDFSKEQRQELLKQNIAKSDISQLITGKAKVKGVELKKADTIMKSNFVENAIKSIKMTRNGGNNIARIMLAPRELGDITLRISMIGNSVKLHIKAEKSEAADHIDRQLPLLKDKLNDSGLRIDQVTIESAESENLASYNQQQQKNEQEELRRQFVKSFRNIAAIEDFELSMNEVAYYNSNNQISSYTKAGSKINV